MLASRQLEAGGLFAACNFPTCLKSFAGNAKLRYLGFQGFQSPVANLFVDRVSEHCQVFNAMKGGRTVRDEKPFTRSAIPDKPTETRRLAAALSKIVPVIEVVGELGIKTAVGTVTIQ